MPDWIGYVLIIATIMYMFRDKEPPPKGFLQVPAYNVSYDSNTGCFELFVNIGITQELIDKLERQKPISKIEVLNYQTIHIFHKQYKQHKASKEIHDIVTDLYGMVLEE